MKISLIKKTIFLSLMLISCVAFTSCKSSDYNNAIKMMNNGNYEEAKSVFAELGNYKDSVENINECDYRYALEIMEDTATIADARSIFVKLNDYKDSKELIQECDYRTALKLMENNISDALTLFENLEDYKDSRQYVKECTYVLAIQSFERHKYTTAIELFTNLDGYLDSDAYLNDSKWLALREYIINNGKRDIHGAYEIYTGEIEDKDGRTALSSLAENALLLSYQYHNSQTLSLDSVKNPAEVNERINSLENRSITITLYIKRDETDAEYNARYQFGKGLYGEQNRIEETFNDMINLDGITMSTKLIPDVSSKEIGDINRAFLTMIGKTSYLLYHTGLDIKLKDLGLISY